MDRGAAETSERRWEAFRTIAAALADTNRLAIVRVLLRGPASVSDLTIRLHLRQPLVSHHLAVLLEAGIVEARREGRRRIYSTAADRELRSILAILRGLDDPDGRGSPRPEGGDPVLASTAVVPLAGGVRNPADTSAGPLDPGGVPEGRSRGAEVRPAESGATDPDPEESEAESESELQPVETDRSQPDRVEPGDLEDFLL